MTPTKPYAERDHADWIDNTPIREAVEAAEARGISKAEICRQLGWFKNSKRWAETTRFDRRIGRRPELRSNGSKRYARQIHYDVAVAICRAIGRDPWELDL